MKSKKKLLVIASLALAGMLMTSCGNDEGGNTSSASVVQVDGDVYAIQNKEKLPYVSVNEIIDLDDYYYVEMEDGSTISTFSIDNTNPNIVVNGHKVLATKVGNYEIRLAVNDKYAYVTINCKTESQIELIEFFDKLNDDGGQNYTLDLGTYDRKIKRFTYENYTIIHNPNYVAAFDSEDPGALGDDGDPNAFVLANLSDGNGYMGTFDETGKPVFENGKTDISVYYITGALRLDGAAFESEVNAITGRETLVGDSTQEAAFLNYGLSNFVENYGYEYNSIYVLDLLDEDNDGVKDTAYLEVTVDGTSSSGVAFEDETYAQIRLSNVGKTTYAPLEAAIVDPSFVPVNLVPTEISTAFENVAALKNYTVTMNFYASDSDGEALKPANVEKTSAYNVIVGGTSPITETTTVTTDGIETSLVSNNVLVGKAAYWNEGGKSYKGIYEKATDEEAEVNEKTEIANVTDVFTQSNVLAMTAASVTKASINSAVWKKRIAEEGTNVVTYTGDVGDNTVADGQTNGLYEELFNQAALLTFTSQSDGTSFGFGTYLTQDGNVSYNDGSTCSYTMRSKYLGVSANAVTNEITVKVLICLPFQGITQEYFVTEYVISKVGTTTNTFAYGA